MTLEKNFMGKIMNYFVSKLITMPPMSAIYVHSIVKKKRFQCKILKGNSQR